MFPVRWRRLGLLPISEGHKLIQNFLRVSRSSARPVVSYIERSTPSVHSMLTNAASTRTLDPR